MRIYGWVKRIVFIYRMPISNILFVSMVLGRGE